jgi:NADPH:quinone reductase-like Zn-dependent oxidoreductase
LRASSLNYTEVLIRRHLYPQTMRLRPPFVMGYDVVGGSIKSAIACARLSDAETDCVADHIGFELRCADRKFISLTWRVSSNFGASAETTAVPRENDLLCWSGSLLTVVAFSPTLRAAHAPE